MGAAFGDLDQDGWLDFYLGTGLPDLAALVPNKMYRNVEGKRFADVTTSGGFGHLQKGHGIAFADLDNDGDQDIWEQMGGFFENDAFFNALYRNPGFQRHWIDVELRGTRSNRFGVGARIQVEAGGALDVSACGLRLELRQPADAREHRAGQGRPHRSPHRVVAGERLALLRLRLRNRSQARKRRKANQVNGLT
jgi:hypothetical protein